jgi:hypothetical protein
MALLKQMNSAGSALLAVPGEHLDVLVTKRVV